MVKEQNPASAFPFKLAGNYRKAQLLIAFRNADIAAVPFRQFRKPNPRPLTALTLGKA